jgi:hypothetical protein
MVGKVESQPATSPSLQDSCSLFEWVAVDPMEILSAEDSMVAAPPTHHQVESLVAVVGHLIFDLRQILLLHA